MLVFELLNKYIADNSLNVTLYSSGAPDSVFLLHPDEDADGDGFRNVDEWDYVRDVLFGPDAYIPDYYLYVWLYVFYVGDPDLLPSVSDPDEYEDREFVAPEHRDNRRGRRGRRRHDQSRARRILDTQMAARRRRSRLHYRLPQHHQHHRAAQARITPSIAGGDR